MNSDISCPSHPDAQIVEDHRAGDLICTQCGLVVGERVVDVGTEWRSFSDEQRSGNDPPSRVGAPDNPVLSSPSDLSTSIAVAHGSECDRALENAQRKLKNSSNERQMNQALMLIVEMGEKINLARTIQDRAAKRFKEILESKALRAKSNEAQAAACLYIACREEGVPRTFKEICAVSKVSIKEIGRCFHLITKTLETNLALITSGDYMSRFCGNLNLPYPVQVAATRIAQKAVEMDLVAGRSPISIAAAAIFLASQASAEKRTAKEIGEIVGAAEDTIRLTYRLLLPKAKELFPPEFRFDTSIEQLPRS